MKKISLFVKGLFYTWFPLKSNNYNEFLDLIIKKRPLQQIVIKTEIERPHISLFGSGGVLSSIGLFTYNLIFIVIPKTGRPVVCKKNYSHRYGSAYRLEDSFYRAQHEIQLLIDAEKEVQKLKKVFPTIQVEYEFMKGKYANTTYWDKIHESAQKLKLEI